MELEKIVPSAKQLYILRAVSGAGKSTFIEKFKALHKDKDIVSVSADHFFMKNGEYHFNKNLLAVAHGTCKGNCERAIQKGTDIIFVDNTNLKYQEMKPYVKMAEAAGYNWNIINIETPVAVIIERQKTCKNISEDVIYRMVEKLKTSTFSPDIKKKMFFIQGSTDEELQGLK